jgi:hypothetical protein
MKDNKECFCCSKPAINKGYCKEHYKEYSLQFANNLLIG